MCYTVSILGQSAGSIAFTGFNADSPDGCSFVVLEDLVPPLQVYFTDNEPIVGGGINSGEGFIRWNLNINIPAGTIIVFTNINSSSGLDANIGTLSDGSGALNLAADGDALFAYLGTSETNPTVWLAGIQNEAGNQGDLASTGLNEGTTFVTFTASGHPDGGEYSGNRSGETAFSDYLPLIGSPGFWTTNTSDGTAFLPFSEAVFTIQPLPIKLISFDFEINKSGIELTWKTSTEINNEKFEIERSSKGSIFSQIGSVKGQGNSYSKNSYNFLDSNPSVGISYYRLKQVDFDGKYEYSPIIKVENKSNRVKIYPTNIVNTINIEIEDTESAKLTIINSVGASFRVLPLTSTFNSLDISELPSGIYYAKVESNTQFYIERIVKY